MSNRRGEDVDQDQLHDGNDQLHDGGDQLHDGGDQLHRAMGEWGAWQRKQICLIGVFCIPTCWHILIMTFMNAKVRTNTQEIRPYQALVSVPR